MRKSQLLQPEMTMGHSADLEPVDAAPGRLVVACVALEHLHHETFAAVFDAFIQEGLNVLCRFAVG